MAPEGGRRFIRREKMRRLCPLQSTGHRSYRSALASSSTATASGDGSPLLCQTTFKELTHRSDLPILCNHARSSSNMYLERESPTSITRPRNAPVSRFASLHPMGWNSNSRCARRRAAQRGAQCAAQLVVVTRRHEPCNGAVPSEQERLECVGDTREDIWRAEPSPTFSCRLATAVSEERWSLFIVQRRGLYTTCILRGESAVTFTACEIENSASSRLAMAATPWAGRQP